MVAQLFCHLPIGVRHDLTIDYQLATADRRLYLRDIKVQITGKLVPQAVWRDTQVILGQSD
jgi:hypothetical protein